MRRATLRYAVPLIAAGMLLPAPGRAQPLEDLLRTALSENPAVRAEAARTDAARARVRSARAEGLPQVSAGGTYEFGSGDYDPGPNGRALLENVPSGPEDSLSLGGQNGNGRLSAEASVEQPIFTGLRIRNGIKRAKAAAEGQDARLDLARLRTGLAIVDAYTGVVAARAAREAALAASARFDAETEAAGIRFETGRQTRTDLALAQAQSANARGLVAGREADLIAARAELTRLVGAAGAAPRAAGTPTVPQSEDAAVAGALARHPALRAALADAAAAEAGLRAAKGARSPQVSARARAAYAEDQFLTGDELTALTLTAQVRVPIFEGGAIGAAVAEARAEARAARFAVDDARRAVASEAEAAWARYRAASAADEASALRAEAAALAAEGAGLERSLGQRSLQDTLAALQLAADARAAEATARRDLVRAAYGLRAAAGLPLAE